MATARASSYKTTITVTHNQPPRTVVEETLEQGPNHFTRGTHVLILDLSNFNGDAPDPEPPLEVTNYVEVDPPPPREGGPRATLLQHIRDVVAQDQSRSSLDRIDRVRIKDDAWKEQWQALDGLNPKHVEISSGYDEGTTLVYLDGLSHPWKEIESFSLGGFTLFPDGDPLKDLGDWTDTDKYWGYPVALTNVETAVMNYCHLSRFIHPLGFRNLKKLNITGNDALDMFMNVCEDVPNLAERIEVLHLQSGSSDLCQHSLSSFQERLKTLPTLKDFKLVVLGQEVEPGHAGFIPPSVERLAFHGSQSRQGLQDLDRWLEHARDPAWLPNLKYFTFKPDARRYEKWEHLTKEEHDCSLAPQFSAKIPVLYNLLGKRETPVIIVE